VHRLSRSFYLLTRICSITQCLIPMFDPNV
jgi:hypothetical protein